MPTAWVLSLRADGELPESLPTKLHGLACALLEPPGPTRADADGERRAAGHDAQAKPFAIWPLLRESAAAGVVSWRLNWLRDPPGAHGDGASPTWPVWPRRLRLGPTALHRLGVRELVAPFAELGRQRPGRRCELTFLSPTYFSRSGRDYPLPDPELLFGRLAHRWNQHVGDPGPRLDEELIRRLRAQAIVIAHDIATVRTGQHRATVIRNQHPLEVDYQLAGKPTEHDPAERAGFLGTAILGLRQPDSAVAHAFAALCAFAEYADVGAQTTHGLGAVQTFPQ